MALSNIQAVQNYQGAYTPKILATLYNEFSIPKTPGVRVMNGLTVSRQLWGYEAFEGVRPLDVTIETNTRKDGKVLLRSIEPKRAQKILEIIPDELVDTFLYEGTPDLTREQPPLFAQAYWEGQMKKVAEEIEMNSFDGRDQSVAVAYVAANTYAVGDAVKFSDKEFYVCVSAAAANQTPATHLGTKWVWASNRFICDGWNTIVAQEIAASNLTPVVTGPITATNAVDKIDGLMWASVPQLLRNKGVKFFVSYDVYDKRMKSLRAMKQAGQFYTEADIAAMATTIMDSGGRGTIVPCNWMGTSQRVMVTLDNNLVMGTNTLNSSDVWGNNVPTIHGYRTVMKYTLAFQFDDLRYLIVNDQK